MASKSLAALLARLPGVDGSRIPSRISSADTQISSLIYDSRHAEPGALFVALVGDRFDGHDYVDDALRRGAVAVVHEKPISSRGASATFVRVDDSRRALSALAAALYGDPSRELFTIGITGTDGKSTTVYLVHQLLEATRHNSGFLSTPMVQTGEEPAKNPFRNSTPESLEVQRMLREMVQQGRSYAVVEATSHGLSSRTSRLADVRFDVGVFTNLSHEHLEFHGTYEQYRSDKANLFRALDDSAAAFGVINIDDDAAPFFSDVTRRPVLTYSTTRSDADLFATNIRASLDGARFDLHSNGTTVPVVSPLFGEYNVSNLLAALLVVQRATDATIDELVSVVPNLRSLPGRMTYVGELHGGRVIVDYAHTPGAFSRLLPQLKQMTEGRLIVLFGSAGDRDKQKRPLQARAADDFADIAVLADEDPRGEEPTAILDDIASGFSRRCLNEDLYLIPDRRVAIRTALSLMREGDTVALLGKGHESSIIYRDGPLEWDEVETARALMRELSGG